MIALAGADLARIELILQQACGLTLSPALRRGLGTGVARAAKAMGLAQDAYLAQLRAGEPESVARLVEQSVIGETYFFRHPEQFAALREKLGSDFAGHDSLLVWSAGCASGEEPYSVAMALRDAGRAQKADRIVATDVSDLALAKARLATYGKWSLRRLDESQRHHFEPRGGQLLAVKEEVRRKVELRRHNLVHDPPPVTGCQLVFCRNVLIYFAPETAALVLRKLADALAPGGYLVLGPVEVSLAATLPLQWIERSGATLLRRPLPGESTGPGALSPAPAPARRATPALVRRATPSPRPASRRRSSATLPAAAPASPSRFELAREAARAGRLDEAERLAREEMSPESYLLLSMAAESRGDLKAALDHVRKALYLEPTLATAHAQLVPLYLRLGKPQDSERARRNALEALEGLDEAAVLRGVEAITAGALRRALAPAARR